MEGGAMSRYAVFGRVVDVVLMSMIIMSGPVLKESPQIRPASGMTISIRPPLFEGLGLLPEIQLIIRTSLDEKDIEECMLTRIFSDEGIIKISVSDKN
jgi:hypothetical protein